MLKVFGDKMLAVPNSLQKANGWSCSFQQLAPRRLGCNCLYTINIDQGFPNYGRMPNTAREAILPMKKN